MLVKTEVTKTYWIGVDANQKDDLLNAILCAFDNDAGKFRDYSQAQEDVLNDLRLALLTI